jgi:hypothetical protein
MKTFSNIGKTNPEEMASGKINKELDNLEAQSEILTDRFIASGRGFEKSSETMEKSDPLAVQYKEIQERLAALRHEICLRYGLGAPRRLPFRFKKRTWKSS